MSIRVIQRMVQRPYLVFKVPESSFVTLIHSICYSATLVLVWLKSCRYGYVVFVVWLF